MALFKKKKSNDEQGRASASSKNAPGRSVSRNSQRPQSQQVPGPNERRAPSDRLNSQRNPQGQSQQRNPQRVPPAQEGQRRTRQADPRTARAGSQRRSPLERITPSRGHKPSQRNTSVNRQARDAAVAQNRQKASALRQRQQQQRQQQAKRQMPQGSSNSRMQPRASQNSRPVPSGSRPLPRASRNSQPMPQQQNSRPLTQNSQPMPPLDEALYTSHSVEELREADRRNGRTQRGDSPKKGRRRVSRYIIAAIIVVVLAVGGVAGGIAIYNSSLFSIQNVKVTGVEHLTASEMTQLANVPADTTLLRVDTATIAERVKASAWVEDVQVKRIFPDTLELVVTEREMAAIVEIPVKSISGIKQWAIAKDTMWLMPIPEAGSEAAKTTSAKIYEDAENVIHIKDVPFGTVAEIGKLCTDATVNNVMAILSGMTSELADMVVEVSASGIAETTLILNNGVEVAFGEAKDIRDKERVVLEILSRNPDGVSYINVRMVETPTWRAI